MEKYAETAPAKMDENKLWISSLAFVIFEQILFLEKMKKSL